MTSINSVFISVLASLRLHVALLSILLTAPCSGQTTACPLLGSSNFFGSIKARLTQSKTKTFYFSDLSITGEEVLQVGEIKGVAFNAADFRVSTHVVAIADVGTIIDDVVSENPDAEVILNGAQFGYNCDSFRALLGLSQPPNAEPMVTIGNVVNNHTLISTNQSIGARKLAVSRYWLAQDYGALDNGGAYSFAFSEYPISEFVKGNPPILDTALGGLVSLIMPLGNLQKSSGNPTARDLDLGTYEPLRLWSRRKSLGYGVGFNVIAVDRDSGMIVIVTKQDGLSNSGTNLFRVQDLLFRSGADLALVTDGGQSTGCWVRGKGVVTRGWRQIREHANLVNTVTNYLMFKGR